ncbi:hypothetical protein KR018_005561 [Drosophila ironensis]|nr:hypothetical protein KR018_005561 [Drosophila ironensis]
MTSQPAPSAHEKRIHELDHDVECIFDVRKRLGKGAYGIVWKATDKRHKDTVALKKIYDAFRDETDAQRTYREVIFLRAFRHHPNIIRLLDIFRASNNLDFYLVFEFMESDLHNVIKKGDVLKDIHKRFVMYQLINAIKYMHSGNVIHRDLKPSNILIDSKCRLKVADFGLARTISIKRKSEFEDVENEAMLTDYVATRWYRAPEILVASRKYTKGIDMWSLGCILGEMIRQKPLFQGTSTVNQIEKIVTALPDVTQRDIDSIGAGFGTVLLSRSKINRDRRHSLEEMLRNCCDEAMSLVKALLVLDPHGRLTAKAAISHPFVSRFRTASADMELRMDINPPLKDEVRYSVDEYRRILYEMVGTDTRPTARKISAGRISQEAISTAPKISTTASKGHHHQRSLSRPRTLSDKRKIPVERQPPPQAPQQRQQQQASSIATAASTSNRNFGHNWAEQQQKQKQPLQLVGSTSGASTQQRQSLQRKESRSFHHKHQNYARALLDTSSAAAAALVAPAVPALPPPPPPPAPAHSAHSVHPATPANPHPNPNSNANPIPNHNSTTAVKTRARTALMAAERNLAMARNTHAALRKQLAAVAATAPRKRAIFWQHQTRAQQQVQDAAEARMQALIAKAKMPLYNSPMEKLQWSADNGSAAGEPEAQPETQVVVSRTQKKPQDTQYKAKQTRQKTRALAGASAGGEVAVERTPQKDLSPEGKLQRRKQVDREHKERQVWDDQELQDRETRVAENLRLMELERIELEKLDVEHNQLTAAVKAPKPDPKPTKPPLPAVDPNRNSDDSDQYCTPRNILDSEIPPREDDAAGGSTHSNSTCYISRIAHLEAEMDMCKRLLRNYVEEHQEVLSHRKLRYHFEQLQPSQEPAGEDNESVEEGAGGGSDGGGGGGGGGGDSGAPGYKSFLLEQHRQRQLQLKEFLARDESNAYDHPDLTNVYKVKSYAYTESVITSTTPISRPYSSLFPNLHAPAGDAVPPPAVEQKAQQRAHRELGEVVGETMPDPAVRQAFIQQQQKKREREQEKKQQQLRLQRRHHSFQRARGGPTFEHMRMRPDDIQEVQFVDDDN